MRILIVSLLLMTAGCSTLEKTWDNFSYATNFRKRESAAKQEKLKQKLAQVYVGNSKENFEAQWGDPEYSEFIDGKEYLHHYEEYENKNTVFIFENGKLTGWQIDAKSVRVLSK